MANSFSLHEAYYLVVIRFTVRPQDREAAMSLADSSDNILVERMIRVEDALAYQIERPRVDFTAPNRRIAFAIDQCEQRPD